MRITGYGSKEAPTVLIQPVDDHDLEAIENEVSLIRQLTGQDFRLVAAKVDSWNSDLSPWEAPAVFGSEDFGCGAERTLSQLLELCEDRSRTYYLGGYSLAGLFALWAGHRTDVFAGIAAASPSVWFPRFTDFMQENEFKAGCACLSLGDREERTRNPVMSTVADRIRTAHGRLAEQDVPCTLEWNKGNHFKDADLRTAKAFAWVMSRGADAR